jgi:hypothetical protein
MLQCYLAEGIVAGYAYWPRRLGLHMQLLGEVASTAGRLLGRALAAEACCGTADAMGKMGMGGDEAACGGEDIPDLLVALQEATGLGLRELKEEHFPGMGFGELRLALAHLARCNPLHACNG